MNIVGKIHHLGDNIAGTTERGTWVRKTIVIETLDSVPKNIAFTVTGEDRVSRCQDFAVGDTVKVSFYPESREHEGRWFTDLKAIEIIVV